MVDNTDLDLFLNLGDVNKLRNAIKGEGVVNLEGNLDYFARKMFYEGEGF
jgi:hypothetical protein